MKRFLALLAAVLMLTLCMTACGKSDEEKFRDDLEDAAEDLQDAAEDLVNDLEDLFN